MGPVFYPSTCHPIGRRSFLAVAVGTGAALITGTPASARVATADNSKRIILKYARRRDDPWALVHAVRALGRDYTLDGGQPAVPFVLAEYLQEQAVNGGTYLAFPRKVEVHENMFLKTFLEAGVSPLLRFSVTGRPRTLQDVVDSARALLRFSDATSRNAIAWSIIALTRTTPPDRGIWSNAFGERVDLAKVVEAGFEAMEQASQPIQDARDRGLPLARQAPVHAFTCGGTHLLYALLAATQAGYTASGHRDRVRRQMDLLVYRLWADVDLMDRFYQPKLAASPQARWFLLDARLKFVGHVFECLRFAERHLLYAIPPDQAPRRDRARAALDADISTLGEADLASVKAETAELYQQLVGDVCHAHHGLTLTWQQGGPGV